MNTRKTYIISLTVVMVILIISSFFISYFTSYRHPVMRRIALLFIGKDVERENTIIESDVQRIIEEKRAIAKIYAPDLPFMTYHFNKQVEKDQCQRRYKVKEKALPYLSLVTLDEKNIPIRVVKGLETVKGNDARISSLMDEAIRIIKENKN